MYDDMRIKHKRRIQKIYKYFIDNKKDKATAKELGLTLKSSSKSLIRYRTLYQDFITTVLPKDHKTPTIIYPNYLEATKYINYKVVDYCIDYDNMTIQELIEKYDLKHEGNYWKLQKIFNLPKKRTPVNEVNSEHYKKEGIIEFYENHTFNQTCRKYNVGTKKLNKILKDLKVKKRVNMNIQDGYYDKSTHELLIRMQKERNIGDSTFKGYYSAVKKYCNYCKMSMPDLINEALKEQDKRIPLRESTLKKRLMDYRTYLYSQENTTGNTCHSYFSKITTLYKHFECEIPNLPQIKTNKGYVSTYSDLPTHANLKEACNMADERMKSIILFQSSSGSAKAETLSLTVKHFFDGIKEYCETVYNPNQETLLNMLMEIQKKTTEGEMIVPTFYLRRIKTDKYYYTFCTPEATQQIAFYLKTRLNTHKDVSEFLKEPLFKISNSLLLTEYQKINDKMGWGMIGKYRFFRSHTLRKFNASNIGMVSEHIDAIQGRAKNQVHEAYIKTKPDDLKKQYMKHMWRVCIDPVWIERCQLLDKEYCSEYNVRSPEEKAMDNILGLLEKAGLNLGNGDVVSSVPVAPVAPVQDFQQVNNDKYSDLIKYGELLKEGLITKAEYKIIKHDILGV